MGLHYSSVIGIDQLQLIVTLGVPDDERATPQHVLIDFRVYFEQVPNGSLDDSVAQFLCYREISEAIIAFTDGKSFHLIEYLGNQIFGCIRAFVDAKLGADASQAKVWMRLTKPVLPVSFTVGGSYLVHSDLPAHSTWVDAK